MRRLLTTILIALFLTLGAQTKVFVTRASQLSGVNLQSGEIRFAVIGDFGIAGTPEADVAARVIIWQPDFILTVGDNNYYYGEAATIDANIGQYYHDFIYPYAGQYQPGAAVNKFFPVLGNHDWNTTDPITHLPFPYLDYFALPGDGPGGERYYQFVIGPVEFFMLDSDPHEPDGITATSTQAAWLQAALSASTSPWKLVLLHHAPYSSGPHGPNAALQWPYQAWGADAVLAGHDHDYERIIRYAFPYFVDGLGGAAKYAFGTPVEGSLRRYNSDWGAMLVDATASSMIFQFITRGGIVQDAYQLPFMIISGNAGVGGAILSYTDGTADTVTADGGGNYSLPVSHGWAGAVTPSKLGYSFTPDHIDYPEVTADQGAQDYVATPAPLKVAAAYPSDGSQACRRPQVGVDLQFADEGLTSTTLDPSAEALIFNPETIHLTLDGRDVIGTVVMTMASPATYSVLYVPTTDLPVGEHEAALAYPSATGPAARIWGFTVGNSIACSAFSEEPSFPGPEQQAPAYSNPEPEPSPASVGATASLPQVDDHPRLIGQPR